MRELDCRRLACPAPVLQTKECLEKHHPDFIRVLVDTEAAKQNVCRFLESQNFNVTIQQDGNLFFVLGEGEERAAPGETPVEKTATEKKRIMVMVATDRLGRGDDELGGKLMVNFIKTLKEMSDELWRLVLVNNGVKLTVDGSPVLADLKALDACGVMILVAVHAWTIFVCWTRSRWGRRPICWILLPLCSSPIR